MIMPGAEPRLSRAAGTSLINPRPAPGFCRALARWLPSHDPHQPCRVGSRICGTQTAVSPESDRDDRKAAHRIADRSRL